jgi:DNA primase
MDPAVVERLAADRAAVMAAESEARAQAARSLSDYWAHLDAADALARHADILARLESEGISRVAVDHFGLGWHSYGVDGVGVPSLAIPWTVRGETRALQYRLLADDVPGGRYRWHKGSRPTLYNADAVLTPCDDRIIVVEGAKKCMSLWSHGIESVCAVPSKGQWNPLHARHFAPFGVIVFALDPDARRESIEAARTVPRSRVARMPSKPDDLLAATGGDVDVLMSIIDAARPVD